ncbi:phospholipase A2 [Kitasatospora sp. NPDC093550]|uniref:phospholipase A2 n=1 Tax=Kitasatospora sp. NPDC093550 TaxID=3364089 RepID=UPI0037F296D3
MTHPDPDFTTGTDGPPPRPGRGRAVRLLRMIALIVAAVLAISVSATAATRGKPAQKKTLPTVSMADIVATKNNVYALAADHSAVYEWSGLGTEWLQIRGPVKNLYAGPDTLYATDGTTGDIWQYRPTLEEAADYGGWTRIGTPGANFVVADGHLYGLAPDKSAVMEYTGTPKNPTAWKGVRGPAGQIYGGKSLYATNPATGNIQQYNRSKNDWTEIGGPGSTFTATDRNLYGLAPDKSAVMEYTGTPWKWKPVGDAAGRLYSGNTLYATNPATGDLYKHNGNGKWNRIGGPGATFTEADNRVYRLSPDHRTVFHYTGTGDAWESLGAPTNQAATLQEKTDRFNELIKTGDASRIAWNRTRNASRLSNGAWDRFKFTFESDFCNRPAPDVMDFAGFAVFDFKMPCAHHDFGYRNAKEFLLDGDIGDGTQGPAIKRQVDKMFKADMDYSCKTKSEIAWACRAASQIYYSAVEHLGSDAQWDSIPEKLMDLQRKITSPSWPS